MRSRKPVTVKNAKIAKESMNSGEKSGGASDCRVDVALEFMRLARIRDDQNHAREMVYVYADRSSKRKEDQFKFSDPEQRFVTQF
ncbi:hypothetical protein YC2023_030654 [Brassica napus]